MRGKNWQNSGKHRVLVGLCQNSLAGFTVQRLSLMLVSHNQPCSINFVTQLLFNLDIIAMIIASGPRFTEV